MPRDIKITFDGKEYKNLLSLAIAYDIHPVTLYLRYKRGVRGQKLVEKNLRHHKVTIDGITYDSMREAAKAEKISYWTLKERIYTGYYEKPINQRGEGQGNKKPVIVGGIQYSSISDAAKENNITREGMRLRIKRGFYDEKGNIVPNAIKKTGYKAKPFVFENKIYENFQIFCKEFNLIYNNARTHRNKGDKFLRRYINKKHKKYISK